METADSIIWFFSNSQKQQLELEKWIADVCPNEETRCKLKEMCKTRYVEQHEAFDVFIDVYLPLVVAWKSYHVVHYLNRVETLNMKVSHFCLHCRSFIHCFTFTDAKFWHTQKASVSNYRAGIYVVFIYGSYLIFDQCYWLVIRRGEDSWTPTNRLRWTTSLYTTSQNSSTVTVNLTLFSKDLMDSTSWWSLTTSTS